MHSSIPDFRKDHMKSIYSKHVRLHLSQSIAYDMGQESPESKQESEERAAGEQMCKCQESLSTIGFTKLHQVRDVVLASPQSNATIVEPGLRFG